MCLEKLTLLLFLSPSNSHRPHPYPPPRDHRVQGSPQGSDLIVFAVVTVTSSSFPFLQESHTCAWLLFLSPSPGSNRGDILQTWLLRELHIIPDKGQPLVSLVYSALIPPILLKLQRLVLLPRLLLRSSLELQQDKCTIADDQNVFLCTLPG